MNKKLTLKEIREDGLSAIDIKEINALYMAYNEEQRVHKLIRACKTLGEFSNLRVNS